MTNKKENLVSVAINHFGSKAEFARAMNTSGQNINNWIKRGAIPPANALQAERASGGIIRARDVLIEHEKTEKGNS